MRKIVTLLLVLTCFGAHGQDLRNDFAGLKKINGTFLYIRTMGAGEPIVIVHGGPGMNHTYFLQHLDQLAKKFKLVFYDQRASGQSAAPSADSITLKFFVEDLEAIRQELHVEKLNLFAHSWGAIPAVRYGIQYPEKVKTMILCAPVALSQEFAGETLANQQKMSTPRDSTDRSIILGSRDFKSGNLQAYEKLLILAFRHSFYRPAHLSKFHIDLPANYLSAANVFMAGMGKELREYNYYNDVKAFPFPVLIMHGAADAIPLSASTRLKQEIPKATLVVFKRSGHFIFIDEPRKFRESVTSFLMAR